ncbi:sulfurtransferase [Adhaeribacter aerolatus]|uniref:Sulfurtransferase n=1 Tax=Adhaeribacter aerolatus TaxID=670289 RepID=A0A512B483_9BACT|nr:rhodanese-like domain-containing protein [Adhaeribacter aerolatus]GEO06771.1 sulfurtransferase [Adhaeribacter aerolatus]
MFLSHQSFGQFLYDQKLKLLYKNTVPVISAATLNHLVAQKAPVYLLDIRSPREYAVSHLPGARFFNYDTFEPAQVKNIPKNARVVVYCAVGVRSEEAGEKLKKAGYKQVHNLYGGIFSWKNEGFLVVNARQQPTDSVHTYNKYWSVWLRKGIKVYE